jgi:hypothetical protein
MRSGPAVVASMGVTMERSAAAITRSVSSASGTPCRSRLSPELEVDPQPRLLGLDAADVLATEQLGEEVLRGRGGAGGEEGVPAVFQLGADVERLGVVTADGST